MPRARWTSLLPLLIALAGLGGALAEPDRDPSLNGTWICVAAELGGESFDSDVLASNQLVLEGETYVVLVRGEPRNRGTFKLNTAAGPKQMDLVGGDGPNAGESFTAIYECDGKRLRICYDVRGKPRPTEFGSKQGTQLMLLTYERQKPSGRS